MQAPFRRFCIGGALLAPLNTQRLSQSIFFKFFFIALHDYLIAVVLNLRELDCWTAGLPPQKTAETPRTSLLVQLYCITRVLLYGTSAGHAAARLERAHGLRLS